MRIVRLELTSACLVGVYEQGNRIEEKQGRSGFSGRFDIFFSNFREWNQQKPRRRKVRWRSKVFLVFFFNLFVLAARLEKRHQSRKRQKSEGAEMNHADWGP